ncbi:MAG: polymerase sigma-70 factor, subfamily [Blastocatellia bacterium]|jgi:RNA polymerase sigma-70 factor (ECF subfamily)|nr:polymerase sigma-70 factor, subfamily [Blastocatellia bacterium]
MVDGKPAKNGSAVEAQERLMVEAAQKDPARFAELYEMNFERVYAFVLKRVHDRHETEDLTSEVFHKALENLPRFKWRGVPFSAWLFRIAANIITDRWKRNARERDVSDVDLEVEASAPKDLPIDLEELEHRALLFRQVELLPADQRRVIAMRFAEEKSIREIAQELGRSEGAVKQLQFRGLQTLRVNIGRSDG